MGKIKSEPLSNNILKRFNWKRDLFNGMLELDHEHEAKVSFLISIEVCTILFCHVSDT